jgi:hypothetical protein
LTTCQSTGSLQAISFDVVETPPASELPACLEVGLAVDPTDGSEVFQKLLVLVFRA